MAKKKILGWGECYAKADDKVFDDIVENSANLSVEEGQEQEANTTGGKTEGRKQAPDKYIIEYDRRVGSKNEVQVGYTEDAGSIGIIPKNSGATYAKLMGCSRKITLKQDEEDGLVAHYLYKTKGSTDSTGKLDDVLLDESNISELFTAVTNTSGKNPYEEGWYTKKGDVYYHAFETEPVQGTTYYEMSVDEQE